MHMCVCTCVYPYICTYTKRGTTKARASCNTSPYEKTHGPNGITWRTETRAGRAHTCMNIQIYSNTETHTCKTCIMMYWISEGLGQARRDEGSLEPPPAQPQPFPPGCPGGRTHSSARQSQSVLSSFHTEAFFPKAKPTSADKGSASLSHQMLITQLTGISLYS